MMKAHDFISFQLLLLLLLSLVAYFAQTAEHGLSLEAISTTNGSLIVAPEVEMAFALSEPSGFGESARFPVTDPTVKTSPSIENNNELGARSLPTDSIVQLSKGTATSTTSKADEEDVVISSSEILADSQAPAATNQGRESPDANCSKTAEQQQDSEGESRFVTVETDQAHYSNSRLILRLLLVALFGLVCLSLTFIYSIKFCLCGRRKRHLALQRNLVGEAFDQTSPTSLHLCQQLATPAANHRQFLMSDCPCGLARPSSARPPGGRLHTLLRPSTWGLCRDSLDATCRLPRQAIPSLHQQLALVGRIQQLTGTGNYYPPPGCHSCLMDLQCAATGAPQVPLNSPSFAQSADTLCPPTNRPPAYSELFGAGSASQVPRNEGGAISQCRSLTDGGGEESGCDFVSGADTSVTSGAVSDTANEMASGNLAEPTGLSQGQADSRNLLVKLNLNKTKLLSAGDLVLLSRLIDVPIVVQEQNQQQQQQQQQQQRHLTQADDELRTRAPATIEREANEGRLVGCGSNPATTRRPAIGGSKPLLMARQRQVGSFVTRLGDKSPQENSHYEGLEEKEVEEEEEDTA